MSANKIIISGYKPYQAKDGSWHPGCIPYDTDLYTELYRIKNGFYKSIITECRSIYDPDARQLFKIQRLPSLSISAVCHTWRKLSNLVNHTGLLNIDIDAKPNESISDWYEVRDSLFTKLQHVVACFLSASGKGCTFIFRINPDLHLDTFNSTIINLEKHFNLLADSVTKDIVRLRFISDDPGAKINDAFDKLNIVLPDLDYMRKKAAANRDYIPSPDLPSSQANSILNFRHIIYQLEQAGEFFADGNKHWFLVALSGRCNALGMDKDYCKQMVMKHFRDKTSISDTALLLPVDIVYSSYSSQHGCKKMPVKKVFAPFAVRRLLLLRFSKQLLRKYIFAFDKQVIRGNTSNWVQVPDPLYVFMMHLASPEYNWTCLPRPEALIMTAEDCDNIFKPDCYIDEVNNNRIFINRHYNAPAEWL